MRKKKNKKNQKMSPTQMQTCGTFMQSMKRKSKRGAPDIALSGT